MYTRIIFTIVHLILNRVIKHTEYLGGRYEDQVTFTAWPLEVTLIDCHVLDHQLAAIQLFPVTLSAQRGVDHIRLHGLKLESFGYILELDIKRRSVRFFNTWKKNDEIPF